MAKLESAIKEKTVSFISPKKTKQTIQNVVWKKVSIQGLFDQPFNDLLYQAHQVHRNNFDPNKVQLSTLLSIKTDAKPSLFAHEIVDFPIPPVMINLSYEKGAFLNNN